MLKMPDAWERALKMLTHGAIKENERKMMGVQLRVLDVMRWLGMVSFCGGQWAITERGRERLRVEQAEKEGRQA